MALLWDADGPPDAWTLAVCWVCLADPGRVRELVGRMTRREAALRISGGRTEAVAEVRWECGAAGPDGEGGAADG